ncbi:YckD family protein [Desulfovirgula thermocuniculi]|uniref:YckD family protein n=1 Tax=Desulfovirgula thermocuniculi TaxID=348842 RepID=UPI00040E01DF|nr:YckD family protein [Desulfovirgula thermocuniculi]
MRKLVILLAAALVLGLALPALAATLTPEQAKELTALHQQMIELKKQLVDKYVAYGQLTPEQGQQIKAALDARQQFFAQNPERFPGFGPGFGPGLCPGYGWMKARWGNAGWGMMGGYWNGTSPQAGQ